MIKVEDMWAMCMGVWLIDFVTTFVALTLYDNFHEMNPIAAKLISLGGIGWFLAFVFFGVAIYGIVNLICYISNFAKSKKAANINRWMFVIIFCVGEAVVITSNVLQMARVG